MRRSLPPDVLQSRLRAFVSCHLDYCNSLLARLPLCDTKRLSTVQNAATRLFGGVSRRSLDTPPCSFSVCFAMNYIGCQLSNELSLKLASYLFISFKTHWLITASNCIGLHRTASDCIRLHLTALSVWRQKYLMKVIAYGLRCSAVGRTLIRQDLCLMV